MAWAAQAIVVPSDQRSVRLFMIFHFTFTAVAMTSNLGSNVAVLRLNGGVSLRPYQPEVPRKEER